MVGWWVIRRTNYPNQQIISFHSIVQLGTAPPDSLLTRYRLGMTKDMA